MCLRQAARSASPTSSRRSQLPGSLQLPNQLPPQVRSDCIPTTKRLSLSLQTVSIEHATSGEVLPALADLIEHLPRQCLKC